MSSRALALLLAALAVGASVLAVLALTVVAVAHAVLLWAWTAVVLRHLRRERQGGPVCLGCGRVAPGWLPDGSCMRCAQPRRPPFPRAG